MHAMPIERTIEEATEVIRSGGIVAYPTEAVWGLGFITCIELVKPAIARTAGR